MSFNSINQSYLFFYRSSILFNARKFKNCEIEESKSREWIGCDQFLGLVGSTRIFFRKQQYRQSLWWYSWTGSSLGRFFMPTVDSSTQSYETDHTIYIGSTVCCIYYAAYNISLSSPLKSPLYKFVLDSQLSFARL